jgi:uncharacterized membrane protein
MEHNEDTKITHDEELALHIYIQQAEDLARHIRLVSGGQLNLTVVENQRKAPGVKDRAGVVGLGMEAHGYASTLGGYSVGQNEFTDAWTAIRAAENQAS